MIHALQSHSSFVEVQNSKKELLSSCKHYFDEDKDKELQCGYMEPGHGKKGKQFEVTSNKDLKEMYEMYKRKCDILLWIKQSKKKRPHSESDNPPGGASRKSSRSSYEGHLNKMTQVRQMAPINGEVCYYC